VTVPPDSVPEPPPRSLSPAGIRVSTSEKDFDLRVRGGFFRRLRPYLVPALLSVLAPIGTGIVGYYEGLKLAAARVAALELSVDAAKEIIRRQTKDENRLFVVTDDHEMRLLRAERQLKLEGPVVVVPK
jgi:hypothetical protein